ncbi:FAD-dependent oxidoreductase [Cellulomonas fimi]|uniref:FAD-dependent oxidoreductase n=1 Tax=Cellulomonas fimi TaxID=1708 RepID=A0A7Y0LW88_CELFI|nr:FAD-dependent oxidoreductase [Cellulomonas fimi]
MRSVVVVGAGLAGAQTAAALRAEGFDGTVTVLGAEDVLPYDRPPLSKHLLDRPRPAWLIEELGVDLVALADDVRLGVTATSLVVDDDGVTIATTSAAAGATSPVRADALVVASGAHAVRPQGWAGVTLHTAADAAALRPRLVPGARLVVVGAGWIGAEVAGAAAAAGVDVTVVEAGAAPLAAALGERVGALTIPWYETAGVRLLTGDPAAAVRDDGVRLADGTELAADVVLVAVGVRPATGWIGSALPRDPDGSLRVDPEHRILDGPPHVRAVGDVARRWSPRHGWVAGGHWDAALRGPATAVRALLDDGAGREGAGAVADPAPYVFSTQLGHDLTLLGRQDPTDELVLRGDPAGPGGWAALWFAPAGPGLATDGAAEATADDADDARGAAGAAAARRLTAALVVDRPRDVGAARRLFTGATLPLLDPALAADPERPLRDAVVG